MEETHQQILDSNLQEISEQIWRLPKTEFKMQPKEEF
jgi:hypothetical protein